MIAQLRVPGRLGQSPRCVRYLMVAVSAETWSGRWHVDDRVIMKVSRVPVSDPVTWTYEVTNPGDLPLADIVVTDDQGVTPMFQGYTNGDDLLDPGETWLYEATGTAEFGQYENVATADGFRRRRGRHPADRQRPVALHRVRRGYRHLGRHCVARRDGQRSPGQRRDGDPGGAGDRDERCDGRPRRCRRRSRPSRYP